MSEEVNNNVQSPLSSTTNEDNATGFFIDDYSHLRLSYHQDFDDSAEVTNSSLVSEVSEQDSSLEQTDTEEEVDAETERRNKLREYWISQMPDLPHPAVTMAGIISAASRQMGMVNLVYSDRIEQGTSGEEKFSPSKRSTLNCKQLPK